MSVLPWYQSKRNGKKKVSVLWPAISGKTTLTAPASIL